MIVTNNPSISAYFENPKNQIKRKYFVNVKGEIKQEIIYKTKKKLLIDNQFYRKINLKLFFQKVIFILLKLNCLKEKQRNKKNIKSL